MRRTRLISVAVFSLAGVVGQAFWNTVGAADIDAAMIWIVTGNVAVGIVVGLQHHPFPTNLRKIAAQKKADRWGGTKKTWAPAAYSVVGQAVLGVVSAAVLAIGATAANGFAGPFAAGLMVVVLASLVAVFSLVLGFVGAAIVIWPLLTVVIYLLQRITGGTSGRTSPRVDADGALLNGIILSVTALAGFGGAAVPWDAGLSRSIAAVLPMLWDLLFDFDPNGDVNQPLAWVARVSGLALFALIATYVTRSDRRRALKNAKRRAARRAATAVKAQRSSEAAQADNADAH
jgi:hypothetical protein